MNSHILIFPKPINLLYATLQPFLPWLFNIKSNKWLCNIKRNKWEWSTSYFLVTHPIIEPLKWMSKLGISYLWNLWWARVCTPFGILQMRFLQATEKLCSNIYYDMLLILVLWTHIVWENQILPEFINITAQRIPR